MSSNNVGVCKVCVKPTIKLCGDCKVVYYCGGTCQQTDWKAHKARCQDLKQTRSNFKMTKEHSTIFKPNGEGNLSKVEMNNKINEVVKKQKENEERAMRHFASVRHKPYIKQILKDIGLSNKMAKSRGIHYFSLVEHLVLAGKCLSEFVYCEDNDDEEGALRIKRDNRAVLRFLFGELDEDFMDYSIYETCSVVRSLNGMDSDILRNKYNAMAYHSMASPIFLTAK